MTLNVISCIYKLNVISCILIDVIFFVKLLYMVKKGYLYKVIGKLLNKNVTIYGEEHSTLLPEINEYDKLISILSKQKSTKLLFEHSDQFCYIKDEERKLFSENIKRSGSERVFYHLIDNYPKENIVCFDNRLSMGFLDRLTERSINETLNELLYLPSDVINSEVLINILEEIATIIPLALMNFKTLVDKNTYFDKYDHQEIFLEYIETMDIELKLVKEMFKNFSPREYMLKENFLLKMLINTLLSFFNNLKNISSITIDVNLLEILEKTDEDTEIIIFTGLNHCIRLSEKMELMNIYGEHGRKVRDFIEDYKHEALITLAPINDKDSNLEFLRTISNFKVVHSHLESKYNTDVYTNINKKTRAYSNSNVKDVNTSKNKSLGVSL